MKKLLYSATSVLVLMVLVIGCEQSSIDLENIKALEKENLHGKMSKVDICHWDEELGDYVFINVAPASLEKHLAHGDKLGYSPEGTYTIYKKNGAWYTFTIDNYNNDTMNYSGSGYGINVHGVEYSDLKVIAEIMNAPTFSLTINVWIEEDPGVTKNLQGIVDKCHGITAITNKNYSLNPFPGVTYLPLNSLKDIEGNVYKTISICGQTWMAENLRTTTYNDETPIQKEEDMSNWASINTPAYSWYENNPSYSNPYGALYNWYTVETGKLAPDG